MHSFAFREEVHDYSFLNTTYPWEIFHSPSFSELGNKKYQKEKALLVEDEAFDDSFYEPGLGMIHQISHYKLKESKNILVK